MNKDFKISDSLHRLVKEMFRIVGANMSKFGITPQQGRIIRFLAANRDRPIYQKDIEEFLNIRKSSVSSVIKNLERAGLIQRKHVPEDGRLKRIELTDAALSIHEHATQTNQLIEGKLRAGLDEEEIEFLEKIFDKLKRNLEN
ncbi:MAG TPA: MarR family transcriptional regulator [Acholeplasmataceae bacterium]|nr:MarR family transcriptional regulator [Acholeplasmataceae bacterium]